MPSLAYQTLVADMLASEHPSELPELTEAVLALPNTLTGPALINAATKVLDLRGEAKAVLADIDSQIKELQEMRKPHARLAMAAEAEVFEAVKRHHGPLVAGPWKASLRATEVVVCDEAELLPEQFRREKMTVEPDKVALKAALKAGEQVPGAALDTTYALLIK